MKDTDAERDDVRTDRKPGGAEPPLGETNE
jgi:hypothetical protein